MRSTQMARKWIWIALPVLLLPVLFCGPFVLSRALSNIGMVTLSRALVPVSQASDTLAQAERWLRQAVVWDGSNHGAHRGLAWVLMLQDKPTEAAAEWRAAGMTAQDLRIWGDQARRAKQYGEAIQWYEQMALLEPQQESSILYLQYLTLQDSGDASSALAKLQEAMSLDRGWLDPEMRFRAWYRWAVLLYQQRRGTEAEDALTKAIAVYPQSHRLQWMLSNSYRLLGYVQRDQGKLEQAVQSLEMAVRLKGDNVWARIGYGKALYHYDTRRVAEVEREFAAAIGLKPDDVAIWADLIRFWQRNGELERARSLCLQAQTKGIAAELKGVCPSR